MTDIMINPSAETITRIFLFGWDGVPSNLPSNTGANLFQESIIRDGAVTTNISVDSASFMQSGAGRFAKGSQFDLVKKFFDDSIQFPVGASYSKAGLATYLSGIGYNITNYTFSMQEKDYMDSIDDFAERTYIYNTIAFQLANDVRFVIDANGNRSIANYAVFPRIDNPLFYENFDFKSSSISSELANLYLQPNVDPSNIGRKIVFNFNEITNSSITYSKQQYLDDQAYTSSSVIAISNYPSALTKLATDGLVMLDGFWAHGTIKYLDTNFRAIYYGKDSASTAYADVMSPTTVSNTPAPRVMPFAHNGVVFVAGRGNDSLTGVDLGSDVLYGGTGDDYFNYSKGDDLFDGGEDRDTADFGGSTTAVTVTITSVLAEEQTGTAEFPDGQKITLSSIENVYGTASNDFFSINNPQNALSMLLDGKAGIDTLSAIVGSGVQFEDTNSLLRIGSHVFFYQNFETLIGSAFGDTFRINRGGKTIRGDAGNDSFQIENYTADLNGAVLDGGTGANVIETGDYADISGATLTNLQTLQVNGFYGLVNMSVAQLNGFSAINAVGGNAVIGLTTGGAYNLGNLSVTGAIMVQALTTEALTATGTSGDDTMSGWDSVDATLYGMGGNDTLFTGTGHNHIYGGAGNDTIVVQSGLLSLGDVLDGEAGVNALDVAAHTDLSLATLRNLQKLTVDTDAMLTVTQFNLFVQYLAYGGSATLQAKTPGTYNLSGKTTSGRISLKGSTGGDVLVGDAKAQTLDGGAGLDQLTGGGGADIFKFSALTDSQYPGAMDLIADFTIGTDKIDVSGLGFTGVTTGTAGAGQLKVRYDSYYNYTYVYDTGTGFGFYMAGNKSALTAADFIGLPPSATVTISGTAGNDVLTGSNANDLLLGYAGADQLIGNGGNDVLDGGTGVDQLTGGAGMDVFRFTTLADSIFASGMDRIADFVKGEDRIDLTGLGFTGVTTGTPTAGQLKLSFDAFYNQTYLRDLNGTGFGLYLTGNQTAITNSDMVGLV